MTRTTCLRCDWEGETTASTCPNCGARPLYVLTPSTSTERTSERTSTEVPPPERPGVTVPATADPIEASGRSRRPAIGLVAALVVAVLVGIWLRGGDHPAETGSSADNQA
jgi:ferric-dicitrate binding protein FerR (iron transport regulator)